MFAGKDFKVVQKEVSDILQGRLLVGHAVHHDLKVSINIKENQMFIYSVFGQFNGGKKYRRAIYQVHVHVVGPTDVTFSLKNNTLLLSTKAKWF